MRKRNLLPIALSLLVGACGFHLRGNVDGNYPFESLDVQARDSYGATARMLRDSLKASGVKVSDGAPYHLQLVDEKIRSRTLTRSGSARSAESEITTRVNYRLLDSAKRPLIEDYAEQSRIYTDDSNLVVASDNERDEVQNESRRDIVQQLLLRLQSLTPQQLAALEADLDAREQAEREAQQRAAEERAAQPQQSPLQFPMGQ